MLSIPARVLALAVLAASVAVAAGPLQDEPTARGDEVAPPAVTFQAVSVLQLAVGDLDRAVAFYRDTLGFKLTFSSDELGWAELQTAVPGLSIGLSLEEDVGGTGSASLNMAVGNAVEARARLEARGVTFVGETLVIPGVVTLADFVDPDGNQLRLAGPAD
jgi:predicted enzyme related to lactoylglutathione lyase